MLLSDNVKKVLSGLKSGGLTPENFTRVFTEIVHLAKNIPDVDKELIKKLAFDCLDALAARLPPPSDVIIKVLIEDARENLFKIISNSPSPPSHVKEVLAAPLPHTFSATGHRFCLKLDKPDSRDMHYSMSKSIIPPAFDLRTSGNIPPVLDQGSAGTCAAHAGANALHYLLHREKLTDFSPSRLFMYYTTRVYVEGTPPSVDSGVSIRDLMISISKFHVCDESLMPYSDKAISEPPSALAIASANLHKKIKYLSVPLSAPAIKSALAQGYPILVGLQIYSSFESSEVMQTGVVPMPSSADTLLGGHCLLLCAYSDKNKMFTVQNSWGSSVGKEGFFDIPYEYILSPQLAADFWAIELFE